MLTLFIVLELCSGVQTLRRAETVFPLPETRPERQLPGYGTQGAAEGHQARAVQAQEQEPGWYHLYTYGFLILNISLVARLTARPALPENSEWPQGSMMFPFPPPVEGFSPFVFSSTGIAPPSGDSSANDSAAVATSGSTAQHPALFHMAFPGGFSLPAGYPPPFLPSSTSPLLPAPEVENGGELAQKKKRQKKKHTEEEEALPPESEGETPLVEEVQEMPI
jgi:hypothetical protein